MDAKTRSRITSSTQDHLQIRDIIDDMIITKSNTVCLIIQTSAVNFDLLSEYEQDSKIMAFGGLLNSLSFPIQILVKTNRIDITKYVDYLKSQTDRAMTPGLKKQLEIYTQFIQNLIVQNEVLDKKFYIVLSYYASGDISNPISLAKQQETDTMMNKKNLIEKAKSQLYFKRDHVLKQLARMGLTGHQVTTERLIDLFYDIYNPEEEDLK